MHNAFHRGLVNDEDCGPGRSLLPESEGSPAQGLTCPCVVWIDDRGTEEPQSTSSLEAARWGAVGGEHTDHRDERLGNYFSTISIL